MKGGLPMGASCPEAVAREASELRQIKKLTVETVEDLIFGVTWLRRLRVATFAKPTAGQGSVKPSKRFTTVQSRTTSLEILLIRNSNLVEIYLQNIW